MSERPQKPGAGSARSNDGVSGRPKLTLITVDSSDSKSITEQTLESNRANLQVPMPQQAQAQGNGPCLRNVAGPLDELGDCVSVRVAGLGPRLELDRPSDAQRPDSAIDGEVDPTIKARATSVVDANQRLNDEKQALEIAQAQIQQWAQTLEDRVDERTAEIRRRNSQLTMLNTLAKAINQSLDPEQMSSGVLQLLCELFGVEMGVVWICPLGRQSTVQAVGLPDVWTRRLQRGWPSRDLLAQQMQIRHSTIVSDIGKDISPEARLVRHLGMASAAVMPVKAKGEVIGLMIVGSSEQEVLDSEDTTVFDVFSEQFGVGITNALMYEEALQRAERDPVTGLLNHRTLQQKLVERMATADDGRDTLAVILLDIDNFKFFNDTYGHLSGDDVLRMVGIAIDEECQDKDVCGRYGGDEFMLMLPGADHKVASQVAQKIRKCVSDAGYRPAGSQQQVPLAICYGIAVYPCDGLTRHELIVHADNNLFRSKTGLGDVENRPSPYIEHARSIPGYEMLDSLVATVDNKDRYTRRHSEDVAEYAYMLGGFMGVDQEMLDTLAVAGLLHDVGKIGVPDSILRKPGKLTADELVAIQSHPTFGALIVGAIPSLRHILPAVRHHHERYDGRGYPDGLVGTDIPLIARIMAVADATSAMTTDRPYRNGMKWDRVLAAIEAGLGTQFDPEIGRIFVDHMRVVKREAVEQDQAEALREAA